MEITNTSTTSLDPDKFTIHPPNPPQPAEPSPPSDTPAIDDQEKAYRCQQARTLIELCGERYASCRFANFIATTDPQRQALESAMRFAASLNENIRAGTNLVIHGPRGTGKDHLLFALMLHAVVGEGLAVSTGDWLDFHYRDKTRRMLRWTNGETMFANLRDTFDKRNESEGDWRDGFTKPDVLAISDPLPPLGTLTEFQTRALFLVIDERYRRLRPMWVTVNAADGAELDTRMGPQNADRLRDGAVAIHCNWESYRKAGRVAG